MNAKWITPDFFALPIHKIPNKDLTLHRDQKTNKTMASTVGYEKELQSYIENEKAAVKLANYVGELLYSKGVELVLFRNHLLDITTSEIINLHGYAEKVV